MSYFRYKEGSDFSLKFKIALAICGLGLLSFYNCSRVHTGRTKMQQNSQTSLLMPNNEVNYRYWQTEVATHSVPQEPVETLLASNVIFIRHCTSEANNASSLYGLSTEGWDSLIDTVLSEDGIAFC